MSMELDGISMSMYEFCRVSYCSFSCWHRKWSSSNNVRTKGSTASKRSGKGSWPAGKWTASLVRDVVNMCNKNLEEKKAKDFQGSILNSSQGSIFPNKIRNIEQVSAQNVQDSLPLLTSTWCIYHQGSLHNKHQIQKQLFGQQHGRGVRRCLETFFVFLHGRWRVLDDSNPMAVPHCEC